MTSSRIAAVVAGLAYVALGVVSLTGSVPDEHWGTRGTLVDLLGLIGFLATIPAAERLRAALVLGRVGSAALRVTQVGLVAMCVESTASLIHGGNTLSIVFFLGLLITLVGFLAIAVVGLRQPGARWVAPLPFLGLLVGVLGGEHGGFVVPGVVWLVLALAAVGTADDSWPDEFGVGRRSAEV